MLSAEGFFPFAGDEDRLGMVELAMAGNDLFAVSDCELKRPAPSFTLDTVRLFQRSTARDTAIHWLLGADSVKDLVHWYKIEELIDECNLTTMQRAGYPPPDFDRFEPLWGPQRVAKLKRDVIETPLIDVSSTEVRRRLAAREDVSRNAPSGRDPVHPRAQPLSKDRTVASYLASSEFRLQAGLRVLRCAARLHAM